VIAVVAMLLPGTDPVTMLISMVPLVLLFEASLILARIFGRPPAELQDSSRSQSPSRPRADPPSSPDRLGIRPVLFDLQSPRRRRVVQIVFGALAAVFAISFVFFGVGSGGTGGIGDLLGSGGGGNGDASSAFDEDIEAAEARLKLNPNDTAALAELVQLHYSAGVQAVDEEGQLTADGEQDLQQSADAWNKYLKVSKANADPGVAAIAFQTFDGLATTAFNEARTSTSGSEALTEVNTAVAGWQAAGDAQQILIEKEQPSGASQARLAYYLYLAGDTAAADQSVEQAKNAKGGDAAAIENQLKDAKKLGIQLQSAIKQLTKEQEAGAQGGSATGGGSNPLGDLGGLGGSGGLSGQ
jgi:hypothetical protein